MLKQILDNPSGFLTATEIIQSKGANADVYQKLRFDRLELLGDAVLSLVVTDMLLSEFPDLTKDQVIVRRTRLISHQELASRMRVSPVMKGTYINCSSRSTKRSGFLKRLIGGVYLDGNLEGASHFVREFVGEGLSVSEEFMDEDFDAKRALQTLVFKHWKGLRVKYQTIDSINSKKKHMFTVTVTIQGQKFGVSSAPKKKLAEKLAAAEAYKTLRALIESKNFLKKGDGVEEEQIMYPGPPLLCNMFDEGADGVTIEGDEEIRTEEDDDDVQTVEGDDTRTVDADDTRSVEDDDTRTVDADDTRTVDADDVQTVDVDAVHTEDDEEDPSHGPTSTELATGRESSQLSSSVIRAISASHFTPCSVVSTPASPFASSVKPHKKSIRVVNLGHVKKRARVDFGESNDEGFMAPALPEPSSATSSQTPPPWCLDSDIGSQSRANDQSSSGQILAEDPALAEIAAPAQLPKSSTFPSLGISVSSVPGAGQPLMRSGTVSLVLQKPHQQRTLRPPLSIFDVGKEQAKRKLSTIVSLVPNCGSNRVPPTNVGLIPNSARTLVPPTDVDLRQKSAGNVVLSGLPLTERQEPAPENQMNNVVSTSGSTTAPPETSAASSESFPVQSATVPQAMAQNNPKRGKEGVNLIMRPRFKQVSSE